MFKFIYILLFFSTSYFSYSQPNFQWQKTIGGSDYDDLLSIEQTSDGGYLLGGRSNSNISGDKTENTKGGYDYWIVKIDASGNIQWQKTIGGSDNDVLYSIQQTTDGGFVLGGFSSSNISGDKTEDCQGVNDYWIVKTDISGNIQWDKTIGGSEYDILQSIQQTIDGGYILGGWSNSNISGDKIENSNGGYDYWIVKTDATGNIQWQNTIGGSNDDYLYSIQQTIDGGYILGGYSNSNISGDKTDNSKGFYDYWIIKTDALGAIQWQKTIGGSDSDELRSIQQTSDGGYILGGSSDSNISGDKNENSNGVTDYWIVKTDSIGNIQWQKTIGGSIFDYLFYLHQTTDLGYIVGGLSASDISGDKTENCRGSYDYWIIKVDSIGNIQWDKTIGGSGQDILYSIQQTPDGGYISGGFSWSNISGDKLENSKGGNDFWIVKLSNVNSVNHNVFNIDFNIFPNPSTGEINISFTLKEEKEIKIELFNSLGQIVKTISQQKFTSGKNQINFSTEKISKGIYHIKFSVDENVVTRKLVKM